jgi:hypothetical protein
MFITIEKFSKKHSTYIGYYKKVQCKVCLTEQTVTTSKKKIVCHTCKTNNKNLSIIGTTIGNYNIIDFKERIGHKLFYIVKCLKCEKISTKRKDCLYKAKTCLECKSNGIIPTINAPRNVLMSHYKQGAKGRNLEFLLTDKEFDSLIFSNCYYCGTEPSIYQSDLRYNKTNETFKRNGIDRKDSLIGYTLENSVACCAMCNKMKMEYPKDKWLSQINKIYKNIIECSTTIP